MSMDRDRSHGREHRLPAQHPSVREAAIIETAMSTRPELPEAFAAARMFFRFDPGFRGELEAARVYWRGSPDPLDLRGLSEERRFNLRADLPRQDRAWEAVYGLAARWGLDVGSALAAMAFDEPPSYPTVQLQPWSTEAGTGQRYVELRVYSGHAWPEIRRALRQIRWLWPAHDLAWFQDVPEGSRERVRGMDGHVAARALALHYLMRGQSSRRATAGELTWEGATRLWREATGEEIEDPRPWRRARRRLLRGIFRSVPGPATTLAAIRDGRGLGDTAWAAELGIELDNWMRILTDQAVVRSVWDRVLDAVPGVADDVRTHIELQLLPIGDR